MPRGKKASTGSSRSRDGPRRTKCQSASEIARNVNSFETWATFQGCEEVAYRDIPRDLKADVKKVFKIRAQLPKDWLDKSSDASRELLAWLSPEFVCFIRSIGEASPELFTARVSPETLRELVCDLQVVHSAWKRLQKMRESSRKWSEADYVANVYNVFRTPAVSNSDFRAQCSVTLAQPLACFTLAPKSVRVLNAKSVSPDSAIYIPYHLVRELSFDAKSPYKVLKAHPTATNHGSIGGESSFRYQATPCTKLPERPTFEFVSAFWEDKKPMHHLLEDAYRQNRMATTSAVRQLHFLRIRAPIFGLVWAQGTVRAHVDWWDSKPDTEYPSVRSAAYPGPKHSSRRASGIFHEWNLDEPTDILQVFFLVRNIDCWTVDGFRDRVVEGISQLVTDVTVNGHKFTPWKRKGDLYRSIPMEVPASRPSFSVTPTISPSSTPPRKRKHAGR
ncbi:uncharacterized protein FIBRA_07401 [Fibroporia radiculosa]|uniref:Uncharacterized protein n=1 Tax=Fibroporia radiculosa TaxID=599839 RepID=J4I0M1_9APHY|nr:uncharacterized protein FIBRA_07401 [Fibroporia radiculosa]CCM05192.1 predicted protein [Fibroporia radiculosa]